MSGHRKKRPNEGHSHPGDHSGSDLLGHGKEVTGQGALTSWRPQREGLVRIDTEREQQSKGHSPTGGHRRTCQDTERKQLGKGHSLARDHRERDLSNIEQKQPSKGHSPTGDHRGRDLSGHGKKETKQGALTSWKPQRDLSGYRKNVTKQGALTLWRPQRV